MTLITCIQYISILFIFHTTYVWTYRCHICVTTVYDYLVTVDTLPFPTEDDCHIITAIHGCYIHIDWFEDGTSKVHYDLNQPLPYDSILTRVERQVMIGTGHYSTRKSIGFNCQSNQTTCNTIDNLKRVIRSITFPSNQQIRQFDMLLIPTNHFNASTCAQVSNTKNCPETNLSNCQQCVSIVRYADHVDICKSCPYKQLKKNFLAYYTTFHIHLATRSKEIRMGCQKGHACNTIENIEEIKRTLPTKFHLKTFYRSIASTTKSTGILLFMLAFLALFR